MLLVEFMYLVFTCVPGDSYRRVTVGNSGSLLLYLCYVFRAPINSLVLILHERSGPRSVSELYLLRVIYFDVTNDALRAQEGKKERGDTNCLS